MERKTKCKPNAIRKDGIVEMGIRYTGVTYLTRRMHPVSNYRYPTMPSKPVSRTPQPNRKLLLKFLSLRRAGLLYV